MGLSRRRGLGKLFVDTEVCYRTRRVRVRIAERNEYNTPKYIKVCEMVNRRYEPEFAARRAKRLELRERRRVRRDSRARYIESPWMSTPVTPQKSPREYPRTPEEPLS